MASNSMASSAGTVGRAVWLRWERAASISAACCSVRRIGSSNSNRVQGGNLLHRIGEVPLRLPQIVVHLHAKPNLGTVTAQFAKAYRHFRSDGRTLGKDRVQSLARDTQLLRGSLHRQPQCRQYILPQQLSRMAWPKGGGSLNAIFGHVLCCSLPRIHQCQKWYRTTRHVKRILTLCKAVPYTPA